MLRLLLDENITRKVAVQVKKRIPELVKALCWLCEAELNAVWKNRTVYLRAERKP